MSTSGSEYRVRRGHTVPTETPQSMFEDPSRGSKTTQYLLSHEEFQKYVLEY